MGCQRNFSVAQVPNCSSARVSKDGPAYYLFPPHGPYKSGKAYEIVLPTKSGVKLPILVETPLDTCKKGPKIRVDAGTGQIVLSFPAYGKFLPHDQTLRAVRKVLQNKGFSDDELEEIDCYLEKQLPREVDGPYTDEIEIRPGYRLRVERAGLVMATEAQKTNNSIETKKGEVKGDMAVEGEVKKDAFEWSISTQAGTGENVYYITRDRKKNTLNFNALFSLVSNTPFKEDPRNVVGGVHLVALSPDLQASWGDQTWRSWRIRYPKEWDALYRYLPNSTTGIVLVGTTSRYAADIVSSLKGGNLLDACATKPETVRCLCFAGRTMVTPEFRVLVQGQATWLPVGSSLKNVLETYFNSAQTSPSDLYETLIGKLRLRRLHGATLADVPLQPLKMQALEILFQPGDELTW